MPKRKKSMRKNLRVRKKNLKKNKKKNFPKCLKKFFAEGGVLYFGLEVALRSSTTRLIWGPETTR
ncbi:MAG: hypothetical protein FD143_3362, partial [Ignavibacteria bacterium]